MNFLSKCKELALEAIEMILVVTLLLGVAGVVFSL